MSGTINGFSIIDGFSIILMRKRGLFVGQVKMTAILLSENCRVYIVLYGGISVELTIFRVSPRDNNVNEIQIKLYFVLREEKNNQAVLSSAFFLTFSFFFYTSFISIQSVPSRSIIATLKFVSRL